MTWISYRAGDVRGLLTRRLQPGETLTAAALGYTYEPSWPASGWSALGVLAESVVKGAWPLDRSIGRPWVVGRTNRRLVLVACHPSTDARGEPTLAEEDVESFALDRLGANARAESDADNVTLHFDGGTPGERRAFFFNRHSVPDNLEQALAVVRPWLR